MDTQKPKLLLIDADLLIYSSAWAYRDVTNKIGAMGAKNKLSSLFNNILEATNPDLYCGFFGAKENKNYRFDVAQLKPYKGTRKPDDYLTFFKPILKDYMENVCKFTPCSYIESDDALAIMSKALHDDYDIIYCFVDKDLKQLAYLNNKTMIQYNPNERKFYTITPEEGMKHFYKSCIAGDSVDNISGVEGLGKVASDKIIDSLNPCNEETCFEAVKNAYIKKYSLQLYEPIMLENYILLTMINRDCFDFKSNNIPLIPYVNKKEEKHLKTLNDL